MMAAYFLIGMSMLILGGSAVLAFFWAARDGQFQNMRGGAQVIFDEDEPIGTPTDMIFKKRTRKNKVAGKEKS